VRKTGSRACRTSHAGRVLPQRRGPARLGVYRCRGPRHQRPNEQWPAGMRRLLENVRRRRTNVGVRDRAGPPHARHQCLCSHGGGRGSGSGRVIRVAGFHRAPSPAAPAGTATSSAPLAAAPGSFLCRRRIAQVRPGASVMRSLTTSAWTGRRPRAGSPARAEMRLSVREPPTLGREYVQRRATRCQRSSVAGETINDDHADRGSERLRATSSTRSAGRSRGRATSRRSTWVLAAA
jgi:hypothetical protein